MYIVRSPAHVKGFPNLPGPAAVTDSGGVTMKLAKVRVTEFQSIQDTGEFEIGNITCLVGKNEAGKTAVLQALHRLHPVDSKQGMFSVTDDYPRRDVEDYRRDVESGRRGPATVVQAIFKLEDADLEAVARTFGTKALSSVQLTLTKGYDNELRLGLGTNDSEAIRHLIDDQSLPSDLADRLRTATGIEERLTILDSSEQTAAVQHLLSVLNEVKGNGVANYIFNKLLVQRVPKFLYFDEYYQLRGCDNIQALKTRMASKSLEKSDHPLLGLISLSRLDLDALLNPGRTQELKNRLEGAGNHLTKQIVAYWSQNKHLQMRFDVRPALPQDPPGMNDGVNIWAEVYDTKHWVSTGVGTRSRGFVWFFSFLAWYSDLKNNEQPLILLLDEPGLFLHAKAQDDLLKYFDSELSTTHQLIYTTHSPFMVDPRHFDRVRIVEDKSIDSDEPLPREREGTKVLTEMLEASGDSLFPLQGALGYEIYQTLFVGPNCLVVEGVSDLIYLQSITGILERNKRAGLSSAWTITPVGGSDKVPTFVALIGSQKGLNVATLIDYQKKDEQTISNLYKRGLLNKRKVLTYADQIGATEADCEDMFDAEFYLRLVNAEYYTSLEKPITEAALDRNIPRLARRIEHFFEQNPTMDGSRFNHYRPARYLAENVASLEKHISQDTLSRFEKTFQTLNLMLSKGAGQTRSAAASRQ